MREKAAKALQRDNPPGAEAGGDVADRGIEPRTERGQSDRLRVEAGGPTVSV